MLCGGVEVSYFRSCIVEAGIKRGFRLTNILLATLSASDEVYYPAGFACDV